MSKNYFSFKEVIYNASSEGVAINSVISFTELCTFYGSPITFSSDDIMTFSSGKGRTLWNLVYAKYLNSIIIVSDDETITSNDVGVFITNFYAIFKSTYEKYELILDFYASNKAKLLDSIKTVTSASQSSRGSSSGDSSTRFNDTPQNSGDYSDDNFTTNYQKSANSQENTNESNASTTSESDGATLMARLKEVSRDYENVLAEWVNEFKSLFLPASIIK